VVHDKEANVCQSCCWGHRAAAVRNPHWLKIGASEASFQSMRGPPSFFLAPTRWSGHSGHRKSLHSRHVSAVGQDKEEHYMVSVQLKLLGCTPYAAGSRCPLVLSVSLLGG